MKNETENQYVEIVELHTFATTPENETFIAGLDDEGRDVTVVLNTIDLLRWLDIREMKTQATAYIDQL
tara:strand:+ start:512 stop:715 length:204 start_codon:yes stop_codon:yes gene_type:complete